MNWKNVINREAYQKYFILIHGVLFCCLHLISFNATGQKAVSLAAGVVYPTLDAKEKHLNDYWLTDLGAGTYLGLSAPIPIGQIISLNTRFDYSIIQFEIEVDSIISNHVLLPIEATETTTLGNIGLGADLRVLVSGMNNTNVFFGIGGQLSILHATFTREMSATYRSRRGSWGNTFLYSLNMVIQKTLTGAISFGIDMRYNFGHYLQRVNAAPNILATERITLSGPQFAILVSYSWTKSQKTEKS